MWDLVQGDMAAQDAEWINTLKYNKLGHGESSK